MRCCSLSLLRHLALPSRLLKFNLPVTTHRLLTTFSILSKPISHQQKKTLTSEDLYRRIQKTDGSLQDLEYCLNRLTFTSIKSPRLPSDIINSIDQRILQQSSDLPVYCDSIIFLLGRLGVTYNDLNQTTIDCLLTSCLDAIRVRPQCLFRTLSGLNRMKFIKTHLSPNLIATIETTLVYLLTEDPVQTLYCLEFLGHMRFRWNLLSETTKDALLTAIGDSVTKLPPEKTSKLLFSLCLLGVAYKDLGTIRKTMLQVVEEHCNAPDCSDKLLIRYFENLSMLRIPLELMTLTLQGNMIEGFRICLKSGDVYALFHLTKMNPSTCRSPRLKSFIKNELPKFLSTLSSDSFMKHWVLLDDLNIEWGIWSYDDQKLILSTLQKYMTEVYRVEATQVLFNMLVYEKRKGSFSRLPDEFQQNIEQFILLVFNGGRDTQFSQTIDRMFKSGMKYYKFSDNLKRALIDRLTVTLPVSDNITTSIILYGLAELGMLSNDFNEELKDFISKWLQQNKLELVTRNVTSRKWKSFEQSFIK